MSLGLFFLYRGINMNHGAYEQLTNDYKAEEDRREEIQSLNKAISEIDTEIAILDSHFINENQKDEQVALYLSSLEELATSVGARAEVTFVEVPNDKTKNFSIALHIGGSFNSVYKFLLLLENSKYELDVVSAKFFRESEGDISGIGESPKWRADFKLKVLSFLAN